MDRHAKTVVISYYTVERDLQKKIFNHIYSCRRVVYVYSSTRDIISCYVHVPRLARLLDGELENVTEPSQYNCHSDTHEMRSPCHYNGIILVGFIVLL